MVLKGICLFLVSLSLAYSHSLASIKTHAAAGCISAQTIPMCLCAYQLSLEHYIQKQCDWGFFLLTMPTAGSVLCQCIENSCMESAAFQPQVCKTAGVFVCVSYGVAVKG